MASMLRLLLPLFLSCVVLFSHQVKCDGVDEDDSLLQGINSYRASALNLTTLTKNANAECLADEIADQLKKKPCTNTTGANTVPGNEPQFSDYPKLLAKCHLNVSNTRDGVIMPACVPSLVPSLVLTNFTKSQYSESLNDTKYTGIGIGSEDNWIVVVLTTNTSDGSFTNAQGSPDAEESASSVPKISLVPYLLCLLLGFIFRW